MTKQLNDTDMRLVKIINQKAVTGEALKPLLAGFTVPTLPPELTIPDPPERAEFDSPGAFMLAYKDWTETYKRPQLMRLYERKILCDDFAVLLEMEFAIAKILRNSVKVIKPPKGKYVQFAMRLTGLHEKPVSDPINWICFEEL